MSASNKGKAKKEESTTETTNPSGIPSVPFIEDLDEFMKHEESADTVLKTIQNSYSKYKMLEARLANQRENLKAKVPEIKNTLNVVKHLQEKKGEEIKTHFQITDGVYTKAACKDLDSVYLWLGANVMVEYSFEEAITLLSKNLESAEAKLKTLARDLDFLKDQITTSEVNIARIYNYSVKKKRDEEAGEN